MFRLGILGSDNSHAEAFAKLANLSEGYNGFRVEDVQVTHIFGTDQTRTREVAAAARIPTIAVSMEEMLGGVDGVACVWRSGSKHRTVTEPFLWAGLPAFVDKPLACSIKDAEQLVSTAQAAGVGFTSFSTLRYAESTVAFIADLRKRAGVLHGGTCSGPADPGSEHCGIFFYGIHTVELMNAVFGYGCREITALEQSGNIAVACGFDNGALVTLNLMKSGKPPFHISAFGEKDWGEHNVDGSRSYYDGMQVFMRTLRTGAWPLTPEELLEPVRILAGIEQSLKTGRRIRI